MKKTEKTTCLITILINKVVLDSSHIPADCIVNRLWQAAINSGFIAGMNDVGPGIGWGSALAELGVSHWPLGTEACDTSKTRNSQFSHC